MGCGRVTSIRRTCGLWGWTPRRWTTRGRRARTAFLDGNLDLARIAYEPLLKAFERHAEGFCGPEEPERMLSTDVGEAKARYLRAVYETTPPSERADTLFEEMGALRWPAKPAAGH